MIHQPTFVFHADLCTGCKACAIACKDKHNVTGLQWRRVLEYSGGQWVTMDNVTYTQNVFAYYISVSCNHCENAACIAVCPTGAMQKDANDIVFIDENHCIGCGVCKKHCPYDAPQYHLELKKMQKCNFCRDNLENNEAPACVAACPCRALDFGTYDTMAAQYGHHLHMAPLPDPKCTKPHFFCIPHRHARPQGSSEGIRGALISNPEEV